MRNSDADLSAVFLLVMFNGIVFSGVQFGIAVMLMGRSDTPRGPKKPVGVTVATPVRVDAKG